MNYNIRNILIFLISSCLWSMSLSAQEEPYNVLFIAVDDLNDYVGYLGGHPQAITPNLDRLASESVIFQNAQCPAPKCAPSRAAILSGVYPRENYVPVPYHYRDSMVNAVFHDRVSLPQHFKENGYKTISIGKIFHGWNGFKADKEHSWSLHSSPKGNLTGYINSGPVASPDSSEILLNTCMVDSQFLIPQIGPLQIPTAEYFETKTAEWTAKRLMNTYNKPVFIAHGFIRPHVPWYAPQEWFDLYQDSIILPIPNLAQDLDDVPSVGQSYTRPIEYQNFEDCQIMNNQTLAYLASISYMDHCLGIILDSLDTSPLKDNTIVVLWSDHGHHVGEKALVGKNTLWEESARVPLLIKVPGLSQEGQIENAPVNLMDLFPTLVELCGLPDIDVGGRSLVPLLEDARNDYNYPSLTTLDTFSHSIRTKDFRYIRYLDNTEELYDHSFDEMEWDNLANSTAYTNTLLELSNQMDDILLGGNGLLNEIPRIHWLQPANHSTYALASVSPNTNSIPIILDAFDFDGIVDSVEIWINDNFHTVLTNYPYKSSWIPTSIGDYILKAVVKDNEGKQIWSRANHIHISDCSYSKIKYNSFNNGWGIWNSGGLDCRRDSKDSQYAYSGQYCIRLRDQSNSSFITSNSLDLSAYDEVSISFTYITKSMDDSTEDFFLEMSTDGGTTFQIIEEWNLGDEFENEIREFDVVRIPSPFSNEVKFRFRCDASGYYDLVYLDDINIDGCNNVSPRMDLADIVNQKILANIYPNPADNELTVEYHSSKDLVIEIFDTNGNLLIQKECIPKLDTNTTRLGISQLNSGVYFLSVSDGEIRETLKFVK